MKVALASIGACGHVYPTLGLVGELVGQGHSVFYLVPERFRNAVEGIGAKCVPYPSTILSNGTPRRLNGFAMGHIPARVAEEAVLATPPILKLLKDIRPDVLVHDAFTYSAMFAGEILGQRMVRTNCSFALSKHLNYYEETMAGRLPGMMASEESLARYEDVMRPFFREHALPYRSFQELVLEGAGLEIVRLSRDFHPHADLYESHVKFVGGVSRFDARPAHGKPIERGTDSRLIYVALGSVFNVQPAFYYNCFEAFAGWDARVVMSVGDTFPDDFWFSIPDNIEIHASVNQPALLPHVDLFISHAGTGSVMEAFNSGVPVLAIPQYPEQFLVGQRIEELGAGLLLPRERVSIESLSNAARRILDDRSFRARATELGESGRRDGGCERACQLILEFASSQSSDS